MDKQFWDERYSDTDWVYGTKPTPFFRQFINSRKPGKILLPADGEGRHAVYAAKKGWQVDAFDFSEVARAKALELARLNKVEINYWIQNIEDFKGQGNYDAVALIYIHLPELLRKQFHKEVYNAIRPGGLLLFEAFAKEQLQFESGGPKDISLLYDAPTICGDFPFLRILTCGQKEIELDESERHRGKAAVLQMTGQKL